MLHRLRKTLNWLLRSADGECEVSRSLSGDVGTQTSADLAYYREHAARQASILQAGYDTWAVEKARQQAMKPAEWALLKPAFQDPINDQRGD